MQAITQWAAGICFAIAAAGICGMLVPQNALGKTFRMLLSVFFSAAVLFAAGTARRRHTARAACRGDFSTARRAADRPDCPTAGRTSRTAADRRAGGAGIVRIKSNGTEPFF